MYLLTSQGEHTSNECCEFPQQLVCRTISEATFKVKEPGSYFPMVSRHGMVSFFGTPPDPVVIMPLPTTSPSYSPVRPSWRGSEGHRVVTPQATSPSYSPASPSWRGPESPDVGTPLPTTFGQVPFSFRPAIQDLPKHAGHGGYENPRYSLASPDVLRLSTQKDGDELFYSPASPSRYTYENHDSEGSPLFSPTSLYLSRNRSPSFVAPNQIQDDTITMTTPRKSSPPYVVDQKKYWEAWGEWHSEVLPKLPPTPFTRLLQPIPAARCVFRETKPGSVADKSSRQPSLAQTMRLSCASVWGAHFSEGCTSGFKSLPWVLRNTLL